MSITELSVRRPVTGVMVFLSLTILGLFTFSRLKLDMLPTLEFPIVAVITQYPGAGPEAVEQLVSRPIEDALGSVQGVEKITSTSNQGTSIVMVEFSWGSDMQTAEQDVRKNLEIFADARLPDDVETPLTFAFDPAMQPVVFLAVNAPGTAETTRKLAEDAVEPYLSRLPGVAAAEVMGGVKRQIQVRLEPQWLEAYRIPAATVVGALRAANVILPGGSVDQAAQELNINTSAEFTSTQQIEDVVVGQRGGVPVLVKDVATVVDGFEEERAIVRANGQSAVLMAIRKQSDANTVQVSNRVMKELGKLEKQLPEGVSLSPLFNQGDPITRAISNLSSTAVMSIILTSLVLLAFLKSWRTSFIVLVSIPLSMLVTFAAMDSQGVTLNIISMAGLALAVGMLVDNSIVVLENIFSHLSNGASAKDAAINGTKEVAMPIVASTLTTVAVFAPVLFVPGLAGQLFLDMSLTICISLLASLLVALTLVPLMASLMLGRQFKPGLTQKLFGLLTFWLDPLTRVYLRLIAVVMRHRVKTVLAAVLVFFLSMATAPLMGVDFMAGSDEGHLQFDVKAAPGTALHATDELFIAVEEVIRREVPEAEVIVSQFGGGEGFAALFGQNSYSGNVQVRLKPRAQRTRSQFELQELVLEKLKVLPGVEVKVMNQGAMMGAGSGDIAVKIFADDLTELTNYGNTLKTRLETLDGLLPPTFSMEQGRPELSIDLDREQIRLLGLSAADVAGTISTYFLGTTATMYRDGGDEYAIFVRAPREVRADLERLRALPIVTPAGLTVPLETVAHIRQALGPTAIARENQQRLGTVSVSAKNKTALGEVVQKVERTIAEMGPVPGIQVVVAGTAEDLQESFAALGIAFLVAVLLVYMVMASQFESLLEPFVILFAVPLALSGVVLALVITQTTVQVTALIGVILLAGVVVNNGIVLIEVLKVKREAGEELVQAAIEAGRARLRPILMTTLTTSLGMLPLAFEIGDGAEMWAPMARAVIGGMTVSTLLTLVVVPVIYVMLAGSVDRRRARRQAKAAALQVVEEDAMATG